MIENSLQPEADVDWPDTTHIPGHVADAAGRIIQRPTVASHG